MVTITAEQLRAARAWAGLTQRQLAEQLGLNVVTIIDIEIGRTVPAGILPDLLAAVRWPEFLADLEAKRLR